MAANRMFKGDCQDYHTLVGPPSRLHDRCPACPQTGNLQRFPGVPLLGHLAVYIRVICGSNSLHGRMVTVPRFALPALFAMAAVLHAQTAFFPLKDVKPGMHGI